MREMINTSLWNPKPFSAVFGDFINLTDKESVIFGRPFGYANATQSNSSFNFDTWIFYLTHTLPWISYHWWNPKELSTKTFDTKSYTTNSVAPTSIPFFFFFQFKEKPTFPQLWIFNQYMQPLEENTQMHHIAHTNVPNNRNLKYPIDFNNTMEIASLHMIVPNLNIKRGSKQLQIKAP